MKISVTHRDGSHAWIEARSGVSLMEALKDRGVHELVAECGGSCSCGTCHVYLQPAPENALQAPGEMEDAMLDALDSRTSTSRLACQVTLEDGQDGLKVTIAPEG